jgi:apolipoprotein N-acyltransferase
MKRRIRPRAWLLALLSGGLQVLIFPAASLSFLSWVALAPLLLAILDSYRPEHTVAAVHEPRPASPGHAFLLAYANGIVWYAGCCYWILRVMHSYGGLSIATALFVLVLFCLAAGLFHATFGLLVSVAARSRTHPLRNALLLSPFFWIAMELARDRITSFPWNYLGIAEVGNVALTRIAVVTGVYGISFEIALVNAAFAMALLLGPRARGRMLLLAIGIAALLEAGRFVPLLPSPHDRVATLVQTNIPILQQEQWTSDYLRATLLDLERTSISAAKQAEHDQGLPGLVVWPEAPAPFLANDPFFAAQMSQIARESSAYVVVGHIGQKPAHAAEPARIFNSAAVISPTGEWSARYDKIHLVPFGEYVPFERIFSFASGLTKEVGEFSRGESRRPLSAGHQQLGVFICYEAVFPEEVREFAHDGAEVFINISDDAWFGRSGAPEQHLNHARMRAIEDRRWLLRSTNNGITAVIDPLGRVLVSAPRDERVALNAPYASIRETTFYTRHGDWFAWGCVIISVVGLLALARTRSSGRLLWSKN